MSTEPGEAPEETTDEQEEAFEPGEELSEEEQLEKELEEEAAARNELSEGETSEDEETEEEEPEEELDPRPYMRDEEPSGKTDKAKYWLLRGLTDEEVEETHKLNHSTVRMARADLIKEGLMKKERKPPGGKKEKAAAIATQASAKGIQIFAKGAPPEAIIESITIPSVDGQLQGFEMGMKFGMSQLVLAVRIMQELSGIGLQQVKPLIDMVRSVREGEHAAFKGGADEAAMKAAQAMGATVLPMISELGSKLDNVQKGSETDPMKSMMVRTMEPLMKNMMQGIMPGMEKGPPSGFTKTTE